jgi:hypothetical protein
MELITVTRLEGWFAKQVQGLRFSPETLAYVVGVLKNLSRPREGDDMSKQSIVLAYRDASTKNDFAGFQRLGDWVLWVDVMTPELIDNNRQVVESYGRLSYLSCHRILRGQWHVYEELADELPLIAAKVRQKLV